MGNAISRARKGRSSGVEATVGSNSSAFDGQNTATFDHAEEMTSAAPAGSGAPSVSSSSEATVVRLVRKDGRLEMTDQLSPTTDHFPARSSLEDTLGDAITASDTLENGTQRASMLPPVTKLVPKKSLSQRIKKRILKLRGHGANGHANEPQFIMASASEPAALVPDPLQISARKVTPSSQEPASPGTQFTTFCARQELSTEIDAHLEEHGQTSSNPIRYSLSAEESPEISPRTMTGSQTPYIDVPISVDDGELGVSFSGSSPDTVSSRKARRKAVVYDVEGQGTFLRYPAGDDKGL